MVLILENIVKILNICYAVSDLWITVCTNQLMSL